MEYYILYGGMALCLFSLWAIARYDWLRLTRPSRRVTGVVTGHLESWEDSACSYAAIYAFEDEAGRHVVEDALHQSFARPAVGTRVELTHPEGHPQLARPPRPRLWGGVYLLLLGLLGILAAKTLGILPD